MYNKSTNDNDYKVIYIFIYFYKYNFAKKIHIYFILINKKKTKHSLHAQVQQFRENPKTMYRHNDQLEELRNAQDKFQEEKATWLKQKEQDEKDIDEQRKYLQQLQKQNHHDEEDIKQQREQLYRKMEKLSNQGILLPSLPSPNLITTNQDECGSGGVAGGYHYSSGSNSSNMSEEQMHSQLDGGGTLGGDRRKDKWKSGSCKFLVFFL